MLKEEIRPYIDDFGMVLPRRRDLEQWSGNSIRYTSEYIIALIDAKECTQHDLNEFAQQIRHCQKTIYLPVLRRGPGTGCIHDDMESWDDYIAYMSAIASIKRHTRDQTWGALVREMYEYGRAQSIPLRGFFTSERPGFWRRVLDRLLGWIKVGFVFNSICPGGMHRTTWFGRSPVFKTTLQWAAWQPGKPKPNWFNRFIWKWCISRAGKPGDGDSWALTWHSINAVCDVVDAAEVQAIYKFNDRFRRTYPSGLRAVLFGGDHPINRHIDKF